MMKTVVSSGTATAAKLKGQTVAGKTGTNSDERGVTFCGITGWYVSSIWVGHDNYKPLSSKTTAGKAAIPIWKEYMTKIHQGLSDRDIIEASPSDLGIIKVTTCAVSGQLATDACRNDSMGYGTVTDYWYEPTAPTVYCQMHQTATLCATSKMLATEYCPNTVSGGVVVIPAGHPLSNYVSDPEYGKVIGTYLGTSSYTLPCSVHNSTSGGTSDTDARISDARALLQSAYDVMAYMDSSNPNFLNIQAAAASLESIIQQPDPSLIDILTAMAALTQAMNAN